MTEFVYCEISGHWDENGIKLEPFETIHAEKTGDSDLWLRVGSEGSFIRPYCLDGKLIIVENTPEGLSKGASLYIDGWEKELAEKRIEVERQIMTNKRIEERICELRRLNGRR